MPSLKLIIINSLVETENRARALFTIHHMLRQEVIYELAFIREPLPSENS